jgi:hypothetical protein
VRLIGWILVVRLCACLLVDETMEVVECGVGQLVRASVAGGLVHLDEVD